MKLTSHAALAWVPACGFVAASVWPFVSAHPSPLRGLRNLSEQPALGWPLTVVTVALALFLSLERFHTRRRLLACAAFALGLGVFIFWMAAMVAAPPFLLLGVRLWREQRTGSDPRTRPA